MLQSDWLVHLELH